MIDEDPGAYHLNPPPHKEAPAPLPRTRRLHKTKTIQAMIEDGLMNEDLSLTDKGREQAREAVG